LTQRHRCLSPKILMRLPWQTDGKVLRFGIFLLILHADSTRAGESATAAPRRKTIIRRKH
ncbi:hypothetical protein, partial [Duncaniella muris]|uniref:hypothetical protein n=1 Tax=Duncaniella muris TaxID=2094150 RepID=UPI0025A569A2